MEQKKEAIFSDSLLIKEGGDILSHITAVPSAQLGLTSLFGKVRGEPQRNNHLKFLVLGFRFWVIPYTLYLRPYTALASANILTY